MKTTFTLLGTLLCLFSFGQIQKGTKMVGTSISGLNLNWLSGGDPILNLSLNPSVLKFTSNRFAWGGQVNLGVSTAGDPLAFTIGASPTIRFYNNSEKSERLFLEVYAGGGALIAGGAVAFASYGTSVGYNRFFATNVALELGFGYHALAVNGGSNNQLGFNLGLQIFFAPQNK